MQIPKRKPYRNAEYLDYVRSHRCSACTAPPPSEAHHFMQGSGGMGVKADDTYTVPLCRTCHNDWHTQAFFACFDDRLTGEGWRSTDDRAFAYVNSLALMYKAEAELLSSWIQRAERGAGTDDGEELF